MPNFDDRVVMDRWFWGLLLLAVAWGVRVESKMEKNSHSREMASSNQARVRSVENTQNTRAYSNEEISKIRTVVDELTRNVIEMKVELSLLRALIEKKHKDDDK